LHDAVGGGDLVDVAEILFSLLFEATTRTESKRLERHPPIVVVSM
jgi:hypothetical protein